MLNVVDTSDTALREADTRRAVKQHMNFQYNNKTCWCWFLAPINFRPVRLWPRTSHLVPEREPKQDGCKNFEIRFWNVEVFYFSRLTIKKVVMLFVKKPFFMH